MEASGGNMKKMKIAILGCGSISGQYLHYAKEKFADIIEVAACADIDAGHARSRAEEFGIAKVYAVQQLLDDQRAMARR
jgi:predicted dehydrogenase